MNQEVPKGLVHLSDDAPGITRRKYGKGFAYYHPEKGHIASRDELRRIKALVVPPAWRDVWIAPLANAHLQATGRDAKQRKQYRYHEHWTAYASMRKYTHLGEFGKCLPAIRDAYTADLRKRKWTYEKVAALALAIMDELYLRVGNNCYSKSNQSYGLTTLRRKHLQLNEDALELSFNGKTGKKRKLNIEDKKLIRLVKACSELPGYGLFKYCSGDGFRQLQSEDFNAYLRQAACNDGVSAKDFRTWGANVLCLEHAEAAKEQAAETRCKAESQLVKMVARELGHTISTCRSAYLHPAVLDYALNNTVAPGKAKGELEPYEVHLLDVLDKLRTGAQKP